MKYQIHYKGLQDEMICEETDHIDDYPHIVWFRGNGRRPDVGVPWGRVFFIEREDDEEKEVPF